LYNKKTLDIDEFKEAIKGEITVTPDKMLRETMGTSRDRLEQC
jgi:hypothetical protein